MRERTALLRAAWREQAPVAGLALAMVAALWIWWANSERMPAPSAWSVLVLLPAALQLGVVAGRSSSRSLAFWFARPGARTQLLRARVQVATAILLVACAIVVVPCLVRDPHHDVLLTAVFAAATLALAFVAALVASTLTDGEPLAFGIGTLAFVTAPLVLLLPCEALWITPPRVLAAAPLLVLASIGVGVGGCASAVIRSWRERLPVRDRGHARALLVRCAGAWVIAELLCGVAVWYGAAPEHGMPSVVIGHDSRGLLLASGSRGSTDGWSSARVDALVTDGDDPEVLLDVTVRNSLFEGGPSYEVVGAAQAGERLVVALYDSNHPHRWRRMMAIDPGAPPRLLYDGAEKFSLSPSGETLLVYLPYSQHLLLIDVATGERRGSIERDEVLGWIGEAPVLQECRGRDARCVIPIGARRIVTPPLHRVSVSPDERLIVGQLERPSSLHTIDFAKELPTHIRVLAVDDESVLEHSVELVRVNLLGWLDAAHVVFTARDPVDRATKLFVMDVHVGIPVEAMRVPFGLVITHVEGPPEGPWLVARGGGELQALAPGGALLWEEHVATLSADGPTARRWTLRHGEVVGIDRLGRRWQHPVPWEVEP